MPTTLGFLISSLLLLESVVFTNGNGEVPPRNFSTLSRSRRSWNSISMNIFSRIPNTVILDCECGQIRNTMKMANEASTKWHISGSDIGQFKCEISVPDFDAVVGLRTEGASNTYFLQKDGIFRSNGMAEKQFYSSWKNGGTPAGTTATTPRDAPREPRGNKVACPDGWTYARNFKACYYVIVDTAAADGENTCRHEGAHLVSIHSKEENDFVGGLLSDVYARFTMIGLQQISDGRFQWTDGSTNGKMGLRVEDPWFQHWRTGEPNNLNGNESCVWMYPYAPYEWNDMPCGQRALNLVCKMEAFKVEDRASP